MCKISCSPTHFAVLNPIYRFCSHPHIYDNKLSSYQSGQYVDGCPSRCKVGQHLRGYLSRIGTDLFLRNTVVGGENENALSRRVRWNLVLNRAELGSQLL